jgi:hypothetical protein
MRRGCHATEGPPVKNGGRQIKKAWQRMGGFVTGRSGCVYARPNASLKFFLLRFLERKLGKELQCAAAAMPLNDRTILRAVSSPGAKAGYAVSQCEFEVLFASFSFKKKKRKRS